MISFCMLLLVLQVKHLVCDYFLQGQYMLGKFKLFPDYILPLLAHSAVHGVTMAGIALLWGYDHFVLMGLLDLITHFVVDRVKASPKLLGRWKPDNKYFWWALGVDQYCHHAIAIAMALWIVGFRL